MHDAAFVPVRKEGKLPGKVTRVKYEKEYGHDAFEMHAGIISPGSQCIIFDDLIATGGSMLAAIDLARICDAHVVEACAIIELAGLPGRKAINAHNVACWSLLQY